MTGLDPLRCRNCDALLLGRFCVECSQAADVHVPTTRELMHELLEGLTHSDSRLWRTLQCLWFRPGKLTLEFVAGRRVAYLPPFRLYLVLSVIMFLVASFASPQGDILKFDDAASPGVPRVANCANIDLGTFNSHSDWNPRVRHACAEVVRDNGANLLHIAVATMPKAMFIFLPLIAFLHMLLYWRPRYRYAEHLLFFVHLHAFFFSTIVLMLLLKYATHATHTLASTAGFLDTCLGWSMPLYTLIAIRRVFAQGWTGAVFKSCTLYFVYMLVLAITIGGVFVYALLQL